MYRCSTCGACSKAGQSRLLHIIYREIPVVRVLAGERIVGSRREIAREMPVCRSCKFLLDKGMLLSQVQMIVASATEEQLEALVRLYTEPPKPSESHRNGKPAHALHSLKNKRDRR